MWCECLSLLTSYAFVEKAAWLVCDGIPYVVAGCGQAAAAANGQPSPQHDKFLPSVVAGCGQAAAAATANRGPALPAVLCLALDRRASRVYLGTCQGQVLSVSVARENNGRTAAYLSTHIHACTSRCSVFVVVYLLLGVHTACNAGDAVAVFDITGGLTAAVKLKRNIVRGGQ